MLMRFDPFREFDRLLQQPGTRQRPAVMPMDAYRRGDTFVVSFDLPGINPDAVELTVDKNVLQVSVDRTWTPDEGDEVVVSERPQGHYSRQLLLGENLDAERVDARYEHGVLTLTIPVKEAAKPRKIAINVGDGTQAIPASSQASAA
ncbi:MAG TPA: Hsp20/alpha crystallin family protein [Acidimicrobiales bacterium]|nr:Hsp20/alpha crystallin family protein [Acidimicrobiales bacterium]